MKRLFSLILMSAILIVAMSAGPIKNSPVKNHHQKTLVDVYLNNGTAWVASANIGGNIFSEGPEDCGEVGSVSTGTYTVTLSTTASGSHQYLFTGQATQVKSTGSATFTNVSISGDVTAAVY
jgi:HKD family nuclease